MYLAWASFTIVLCNTFSSESCLSLKAASAWIAFTAWGTSTFICLNCFVFCSYLQNVYTMHNTMQPYSWKWTCTLSKAFRRVASWVVPFIAWLSFIVCGNNTNNDNITEIWNVKHLACVWLGVILIEYVNININYHIKLHASQYLLMFIDCQIIKIFNYVSFDWFEIG